MRRTIRAELICENHHSREKGAVLVPKRKKSKRDTYVPPKPKTPDPSPRWLAPVAIGAIGLGLLLVIISYLIPGIPGGNINIFVGFGLAAVGLVLLTRWR